MHRIICLLLFILIPFLTGCPGKKPPEIRRPDRVDYEDVQTPEKRAAYQLVQEGLKALKEKDLGRAESKFQEAIRLAPLYGIAYYWLARAKYELEKFERALNLLDRAKILLERNPKWQQRIQELRGHITSPS